MLNRPTPFTNVALDARRAIGAQMLAQPVAVPPAPFEWHSFDPSQVLGTDCVTPDLRLTTLARLLCSSPARQSELEAVWLESAATGAYAVRIAPALGADVGASGIGGLLHRLGDMLALRAIATLEHASQLRLDAASKAELCAEQRGPLLERVLRAWNVPARAALTATSWQRLCEFPGAAAEASAVYLARILAIERIAPEFCAPGAVDHAAEELGLAASTLSALRADETMTAFLARLK